MRLRAATLLVVLALLAGSVGTPHAHASETAALFDGECTLARLAAPPPVVVAAPPPAPTTDAPGGAPDPTPPDLPAGEPRPAFVSRAPPSGP